MASLKDTTAAAVEALQKWFAADPYAQSTGLYHYEAPSLSFFAKTLLAAGGYVHNIEDMATWW